MQLQRFSTYCAKQLETNPKAFAQQMPKKSDADTNTQHHGEIK